MAIAALVATACTTQKDNMETSVISATGAKTPTAMIPKAIAYKTSGDYQFNVPVNIDPSTGRLTSYPAPTDVHPATSSPVSLDGGWLLDRRGVGLNTVFTTYTYSEYHGLPAVPDNLAASIIPGSKVTEIIRFPVSINEITPAKANALIAAGDYTVVLP